MRPTDASLAARGDACGVPAELCEVVGALVVPRQLLHLKEAVRELRTRQRSLTHQRRRQAPSGPSGRRSTRRSRQVARARAARRRRRPDTSAPPPAAKHAFEPPATLSACELADRLFACARLRAPRACMHARASRAFRTDAMTNGADAQRCDQSANRAHLDDVLVGKRVQACAIIATRVRCAAAADQADEPAPSVARVRSHARA